MVKTFENMTGLDMAFVAESYRTAWLGTGEENKELAQRAEDENKKKEYMVGTRLEDVTRYMAGRTLMKRLPHKARPLAIAWMAHYLADTSLKAYHLLKHRKDPNQKNAYTTSIGLLRNGLDAMENRHLPSNQKTLRKQVAPQGVYTTEDPLDLGPISLEWDNQKKKPTNPNKNGSN